MVICIVEQWKKVWATIILSSGRHRKDVMHVNSFAIICRAKVCLGNNNK